MSTRAAQRPRQSSVRVTLGGVVAVCVVTALVAAAAIAVAPQIAPAVAGCVLMTAGFEKNAAD